MIWWYKAFGVNKVKIIEPFNKHKSLAYGKLKERLDILVFLVDGGNTSL
jgi:hypothetical protein